jgi:xanthine dehydrogenase accessory factor
MPSGGLSWTGYFRLLYLYPRRLKLNVMSDPEIIARLQKLLREGKPAVLCTLVRKEGSGPRDEGAKMLVEPDGAILGTIGGGGMERRLVDEALEAMREGCARSLNFTMGVEAKAGDVSVDSKCGGEATIFLDVIKPNPRIIMVGSGHIAKPLGDLVHMTGFELIVIDDAVTATSERFPNARVFNGDFNEALESVKVIPSDLAVIVHGETEHELATLRRFLPEGLSYIGLLGSRNKAREHKKQLTEEGFNPTLFEVLSGPLGLEIGAETPEEIAVSIIAELIEVRRVGWPRR